MAGESVFRRRDLSPEAAAEEDYQSFCEALGSSARGRTFLHEYARRNRHADTEAVLTALSRLEETAIMQSAARSPEAERIRQDLRALLDTLRTARPQTENSPSSIKAATLAALIDFAQARIEAVVGISDGVREAEVLAAVPALEQPELPIPHPVAIGPIMALVHAPPKAAERPNVVAVTPLVVAPLAKARELTGIPIVEFDYRVHQAARPVQPQTDPDEPWTALAQPSLAAPPAPVVVTTVPVVVVPVAPIEVAPVAIETATVMAPVEVARAPEPVIEPQPEIAEPKAPAQETYELWLDEPVVASAETAPLNDTETHTTLPMAEFTQEVTAPEQPVAIAQDAPLVAGTAMTAIAALVQQMEKSATPAPAKGRAEAADPLAAIMALSEEERIALFT